MKHGQPQQLKKGDTLMQPLTTHERMTLFFRHEQPDRVLFWYG